MRYSLSTMILCSFVAGFILLLNFVPITYALVEMVVGDRMTEGYEYSYGFPFACIKKIDWHVWTEKQRLAVAEMEAKPAFYYSELEVNVPLAVIGNLLFLLLAVGLSGWFFESMRKRLEQRKARILKAVQPLRRRKR